MDMTRHEAIAKQEQRGWFRVGLQQVEREAVVVVVEEDLMATVAALGYKVGDIFYSNSGDA